MTPQTIKVQTQPFMGKFFESHDLEDDDDIFALGFVNSLFAMQLVMFVEKTFELSVEGEELSIDNFRSINAVTNLVTSKKR